MAAGLGGPAAISYGDRLGTVLSLPFFFRRRYALNRT